MLDSLGQVADSIDGGEIQLMIPALQGSWGSMVPTFLFNSYTKLLGEVIHQYGVKYNPYANDTQLYTGSPHLATVLLSDHSYM